MASYKLIYYVGQMKVGTWRFYCYVLLRGTINRQGREAMTDLFLKACAVK